MFSLFVISPSLFRYVAFVISLCRLRYFVFSLSSFRLFAFVFSSFRYGAFVMAPRNNEKTKWHKSATIQIRWVATTRGQLSDETVDNLKQIRLRRSSGVGSNPAGDISFWIFRSLFFESRWRHFILNFSLPVFPHSLAKSVQMKSSVTFFQSNSEWLFY